MFLIPLNVRAAQTEMPDLSRVQNVYVYNMENDKVLYKKNENDRINPASSVKIMTGVLALEHYDGDYSHVVTVTKESLGDYRGKNIGLKKGEMLSVNDLLYAVICGGANDAANVLAYEIAGSHEAFIAMMNEKAAELGMENTYYSNAYGYSDPNMYTSAYDTCTLAQYAYHIADYMEMCSAVRYEIPKTNVSKVRYVYNSNYLISTNVETGYRNREVKGMNAGSTVDGGHVLVTTVSKNGMTNFYVLMGAEYDDTNIYSYMVSGDLIKWSYDNFGYKKVVDENEMICEIDVELSAQVDYVVLLPGKTIEYYLPSSIDVNKDIERKVELYDKKLEAPIEAGYVAGTMTLVYNGQEIGKVDLITKNNVDRNGFLYILARIEALTQTSKFKMAVLIILLVIAAYVGMLIYRRTRSNRYRYKYNRYKRK